MDREVIFAQLREEFETGRVSKLTATKAMNIYNQEVTENKVTGCLCTAVKRKIVARMMLDWFETGN